MTSVFMGLCITLCVMSFLMIWIKVDQKRENKKTFYTDCKKHGITDLSRINSPEKRERLKAIVSAHHLTHADEKKLHRIFTEGKRLGEGEKQATQQKSLAKLKSEETERARLLQVYTGLHGRDKPIAMFKDLIKDCHRSIERANSMPVPKESDGAVLAGIASGIGGTVPALMSLSTTAQRNAQVREYNQSLNGMAAFVATSAGDRLVWAGAGLETVRVKLVSDMPGTKVIKHLSFTDTEVTVSESGTIRVTTWVRGEDFTIFDGLPAVADGSVIAEVYDGKKKIGDAVMVFPIYGSDSRFDSPPSVIDKDHFLKAYDCKGAYWQKRRSSSSKDMLYLEGICLFAGELSKEYTVKFVPGDLWAIEKFHGI